MLYLPIGNLASTCVMLMDTCVVVLNHNGRNFVESNISSLLEQTVADFPIIWVDIHSTDDSLDVIRNYKNARISVISYTSNVGPLNVMNDVTRAEHSNFKYILFLNVATRLASDCIEKLVRVAEKEGSEFGGCFPRILNYDHPDRPYYVGLDDPTPWKKLFQTMKLFVKNEASTCKIGVNVDSSTYLETASYWGLASLLSSEMLHKVGIDTNLYNYGEERDISSRAIVSGYKFFFVRDTWIMYKQGAVTRVNGSRLTPLRSYLSARNEMYLSLKHNGTLINVINFPAITLYYALRCVFAPESTVWFARALLWVLQNLHGIPRSTGYSDDDGNPHDRSTLYDHYLHGLIQKE